MARIFTDGAEMGNADFWTAKGPNFNCDSNIKRSGAYSYHHENGANWAYKSFTAISEGYLRMGFYSSEINRWDGHILQFRKGSTVMLDLRKRTDFKIDVKIGTSTVATTAKVFNNSTWYLFEIRYKVDDSAGFVQIKVDGTLEIDYSGDTKPGGDTAFDNLYLGIEDYVHNYHDDLALNDTSGTEDNSWCGDGRVMMMKPNSAGDQTQLTPSAGSNYQCVDDVPPNGDTDYVEGGTVDNYDLYHLTASGLASGSTILRVWPVANARDTVANGGKIKLGLKTNSTEYWGDDITLSTTYQNVGGTIHKTNPNTSAAWTISELDALQVGVKVRGT